MTTETSGSDTTENLLPLVSGVTLLDRYTVIELVACSDDANVYIVAVARPCPACGVENDGAATQCGFCQQSLPPPMLLKLTERVLPSEMAELPPASFVVDRYLYVFVPEQETASMQPGAASLRFHYGMVSDPGIKRGALGTPNQDSIAAVTFEAYSTHGNSLGLFMVADGVGGAAAGEVASELVIETLAEECVRRILLPIRSGATLGDENIRVELSTAVSCANARLVEYQTEHHLQMGTTLTALVVLNEGAYILNVGDSRTYLFRDGTFTSLTHDHSYVAMLVANGLLPPDEVYFHPQRNLILRSLGEASAEADIFPTHDRALKLQAGDRFLLCSDGLWEMIPDAEMQRVLEQFHDPKVASTQLVLQANAAGGADNISVILVCFDK